MGKVSHSMPPQRSWWHSSTMSDDKSMKFARFSRRHDLSRLEDVGGDGSPECHCLKKREKGGGLLLGCWNSDLHLLSLLWLSAD